ncbi:RNA polymerase sigma factor [Flectobacillus major]|uniref:RNA polymerase sigma factor n=1 Tax=Flectobacillus major TaxID=103 RepID=UPI00040F74CB|nr:sigma-70 family RNA polymerase sigma factor [Flectobacillus major]
MTLEKQFATYLKEHQGIVHKVCGMYRRDPDDKKDLFQEIVVQLWRAFPKFRHESKVSTWIYQIALNVAISDLRKESRKPSQTSIDEFSGQLADNEPDTELEEKLALLNRAIVELSDIEKAILMLYFEEKSNDEIAEIMGITINNVRVKMTRIREKLRVLMKKN